MRTRRWILTCGYLSVVMLAACGRDTVSSSHIAMGGTSSDARSRTSDASIGSLQSAESSSAQNNNIRRSYSFVYSERDATASFNATFFLANSWSTTVMLAPPSQLSVNDVSVSSSEIMSKNGAVAAGAFFPLFSPFFYLASGTNYFAELPGVGPDSTVSVRWTDQGGQVFEDLMAMRGFSFSAPSTVSMSQDLQLSLVDDVDQNAEYLATLLPSSSYRLTAAKQIQRRAAVARANDKKIVFSQQDLSALKAGHADLTIEKRVSIPVSLRGGNSGSGTMVYRARPAGIEITD